MKIIRNEIRPVGFVSLELNENEVQTILGVFEQLEVLMNNQDYHKGTRGEIKRTLNELINLK